METVPTKCRSLSVVFRVVLKVNLFYYAITGAIVSFYFTHTGDPLVRFALVLPLVMSAAFSGLFIYGAILSRHSRRETFKIRDALGLGNTPSWLSCVCFVFQDARGLYNTSYLCWEKQTRWQCIEAPNNSLQPLGRMGNQRDNSHHHPGLNDGALLGGPHPIGRYAS